jgi:hypothetical protein
MWLIGLGAKWMCPEARMSTVSPAASATPLSVQTCAGETDARIVDGPAVEPHETEAGIASAKRAAPSAQKVARPGRRVRRAIPRIRSLSDDERPT